MQPITAISLAPPPAPSTAEVVATLMECGVLPTTVATCVEAASALALDVDEVTAALDRRGLSALGPPMSYGRLAELALAEVAPRSGYSAEDLRGRRRSRALARWRHVPYATLRLATGGRASYPELGRVFGRDHTTVMHGVARVGAQPDLALLAEQAAAFGPAHCRGRRVAVERNGPPEAVIEATPPSWAAAAAVTLGATGLILAAVVGAVRYRRGRPARSAVPWVLAGVSSVILSAPVVLWAVGSIV